VRVHRAHAKRRPPLSLAGAEAVNAGISTSTERFSVMPSSHKPANDPSPAPEQPRTLHLYVHRPGRDDQVIEIADDKARVRDVITVGDDLVFIDDEAEPVDIERTIAEIVDGRGRHHQRHDLHRHPCRWIDVHITFGNVTQRLRAAPSARIETVRLIAADNLNAGAAQMALRLLGTDTELPDDAYLSGLSGRDPCRLDFELAPR
jgi:hypothetical protein